MITRIVRTRSGNPVGEVILRDDKRGCVGHFYFLYLGRLGRLNFHDDGKIEYMFGKYVNSRAITLRGCS